MTDPSSPDVDPGASLLFHWKEPKTLFSIRLLAASVAAVVIHGLCFYVFQIEEPAAPRTLPQTHEIVMLTAQHPRSAGLLRQVEDYYAGFEGTLNSNSSLQVALEALPEMRPDASSMPRIRPLHPLFAAMAPDTKTDSRARLAVLPETPAYVPPTSIDLEGLQLVLSPELDGRGWRGEPPHVAFENPAAVAPASGQIVWRVAVTPSGRVEFVFPLRVRERPELDEVTSQLHRSRFQPAPGTELQWGTIALQW